MLTFAMSLTASILLVADSRVPSQRPLSTEPNLHSAWLRQCLFCPSSRSVRQLSAHILQTLLVRPAKSKFPISKIGDPQNRNDFAVQFSLLCYFEPNSSKQLWLQRRLLKAYFLTGHRKTEIVGGLLIRKNN